MCFGDLKFGIDFIDRERVTNADAWPNHEQTSAHISQLSSIEAKNESRYVYLPYPLETSIFRRPTAALD